MIRIILPKVYINPMHISRVWTLPISQQEKDEDIEEKKGYMYVREPLQVI